MEKFKVGDVVRLANGLTAKVLNKPGTFMSNGSYEIMLVEYTMNGRILPIKDSKKWIKPDEIAYSLTQTDTHEPLENYMEIIYNGQEIVFIPKDISKVELVKDENGFQTIRLHYEGHIHGSINILIGDNKIENNG